jgi:diaminopropionate ammonia-lyase
MAGLNCGTPSQVAWPLIREAYDAFVAIPDRFAIEAMRTACHSIGNDPQITSGESGAATMGALLALSQEAALEECRRGLGLGKDATILLLNTEGDTHPDGFRRAVTRHGT